MRLDHLLVLTGDVDATRSFWCDAFGFTVGDRPPLPFAGCWLWADGVPCVHVADRGEYAAHAATMGLTVPDDPGGPGPVDHIAITASDYDAMVARLDGADVAYVPNFIPGPGIRQLFVSDPNGVRVEINVGNE
jgi:catechol 2,3-dioxygenase-like lactoylglutathione lyase family enzyme